jgi:hypothetical protein
MLKEKLQQLQTSLTNLKEKLTNFKEIQTEQLTELTLKLNQTNNKLELSLKEQAENEAILEQLLKEMGELEESL